MRSFESDLLQYRILSSGAGRPWIGSSDMCDLLGGLMPRGELENCWVEVTMLGKFASRKYPCSIHCETLRKGGYSIESSCLDRIVLKCLLYLDLAREAQLKHS
jgi:hypothetical protein